MIVYSGNKKSFQTDAINGVIAQKLDETFLALGLPKESRAEYRAFENSLPRMALILGDNRIDNQVQVALEYQIPLTSKRVDFMVGGSNGINDNVVIVELKQWDTCTATSRENVVKAFTGGKEREVAHPSQQAYSYAKLIENFNEDVRANNIGLIPCAYLHNYLEKNRGQICHPHYDEAIADAPVFLQKDGEKLQEFIVKHVTKKSEKNLFEIIENGKIKPSKSLQDAVGSILNGNSEFEMIDEQQVAYATILKLVENTISSDQKHTIIVQGGPGTGKSVIAINLLAKIINNDYSCLYVTKNSAPRYSFSENLIKGKHTVGYLKGLFKSASNFVDVPTNTYDCILTDESHRLTARSRVGTIYKGENQIKEIINASKISVFFIDEDQMVTTSDIGTVEAIIEQAKLQGSVVHKGESLTLTSQFRCNGSDGYMAFLDDVLGIRNTANREGFDLDYDIRVFDDAYEMREALRLKNDNNKARMIAGYCYNWVSRNDKSQMDIVLPGGFEAQWNFTTDRFATDPESFEQVGCIYSTQGVEFEYVGIIIGKDLRYEDGKVITDQKAVAKTENSSGVRTCKDPIKADRLIKNIYKTLLSRGQKGCYVYCEDKSLSCYIKKRLNSRTIKSETRT